jgi:hypothetical protein
LISVSHHERLHADEVDRLGPASASRRNSNGLEIELLRSAANRFACQCVSQEVEEGHGKSTTETGRIDRIEAPSERRASKSRPRPDTVSVTVLSALR